VKEVFHPIMPDFHNRDIAFRQMTWHEKKSDPLKEEEKEDKYIERGGFGGIFSFTMTSFESAKTLLENLSMISCMKLILYFIYFIYFLKCVLKIKEKREKYNFKLDLFVVIC
jgi:cystathionine beta-lyase/cystathionine gamma-synthase